MAELKEETITKKQIELPEMRGASEHSDQAVQEYCAGRSGAGNKPDQVIPFVLGVEPSGEARYSKQ